MLFIILYLNISNYKKNIFISSHYSYIFHTEIIIWMYFYVNAFFVNYIKFHENEKVIFQYKVIYVTYFDI